MKGILVITLCFFVTFSKSQQIDTLLIESEAFDTTRVVYVHTPMFYKYKSEKVKLPVFYILDGQNDWFINPAVNTINYLQFTHDIPQAIVVVIPHENRYKELNYKSIENDSLPLLRFMTHELPKEIERYDPNGFNVLIGHSASASFALYAFLQKEQLYSAVVANTPYLYDEVIDYLNNQDDLKRNNIFVSIGGEKDEHHRKKYDELESKYPDLFTEINTFQADYSRHTAVPIVSNPTFLSQLFMDFSNRFGHIAKVDWNYKLIESPESVEEELRKINEVISEDDFNFSMELPDINGLASRYLNSDLNEYGIAIYSGGVELYPNYYQFHLSLGELLMKEQKKGASGHLITAMELIEKYESDLEEKDKILEKVKNLYKTATNTGYTP